MVWHILPYEIWILIRLNSIITKLQSVSQWRVWLLKDTLVHIFFCQYQLLLVDNDFNFYENGEAGTVSWNLLSVIFTSKCYKLLKSFHSIGWEQICRWRWPTRRYMKRSPGPLQTIVTRMDWLLRSIMNDGIYEIL